MKSILFVLFFDANLPVGRERTKMEAYNREKKFSEKYYYNPLCGLNI
jgi:hypothetical protein